MINPSVFTSVINSYLPEPHASLLNGILFGIPLRSTPLFYDQLIRAGLLHLVVLSGTNITILGTIVGSLTHRFPKRISLCVSIISIVCFVLFVGPAAPIVRAAIMGTLALIATLFGYKNSAIISLLVSVFFIALCTPDWLPTLSFQLSCGATLGIMLFAKPRGNAIVQDLSTSLAANLFTAPLIFIHFKQISFIAPVSNLLVSFLIPPLMILGFATSLLGKIGYIWGFPTAFLCFGLLQYMIWAIRLCAALPFAFVQW